MLYKVINKKLSFANYKLFKIHNLNKMCLDLLDNFRKII